MSMAQIKNLALGIGLSAVLGTFAGAQGAATATPATTPAASNTAGSTPAPTGPVPTKIGVVNIQQAIQECGEGKKEIDALQQRFAPKQVELKQLSDDVENLKKQYQAQAEKLSDDEKSSRAKAIDTKQKSLQRNYEDAQAEFQQAEQEVINRIGSKMVAVLEKYSNANGFAVVLDVSNPQTSPVLWATQGTVITKELVDAYDKANPAGATTPAAKPAGAAGAATRPATAPARPAPTPKKP
ncbi:MAG TPA: OmpH family outer membrane protein [Blattabacteriaceae bacterium]|jgi:outer membrane protein|nr:OmpH family outer membrane protein [Blattabacteriaceae bacterium]